MTWGIEMNAQFYRGYLADDRSLTPHVATLATIVALWSLLYLIGSFAPLAKQPALTATAQWSALAARR